MFVKFLLFKKNNILLDKMQYIPYSIHFANKVTAE